MLPILAQTTGTILIATIALVVVSLFLILCVIVQKPRGGGLAGAFSGGAGSQADSAFGAQASNVAVTATIAAFVLFLLLAIAINLMLGGEETITAQQVQPASATQGTTPSNTETASPTAPAGGLDFNLPSPDDDGDTFMDLPTGTPTPDDAAAQPTTPAPTPMEAPATDGDSQTPAENTGNGN